MNKLPRGITGFRHITEPELPASDISMFKTHCYAAARSTLGRVVLSPRHGSDNFVMAVLDRSGGQVAVLLNCMFPVIGFAVPPAHEKASPFPLQFVDDLELAEVFRSIGPYDVIARSELERPICKEDLEHLSPTEMEQVKYWRPARVGDLVFSFWD